MRECIDAGMFRATDPEAVGVTMWAHAHGLISLYLRGSLSVDREAFEGLYAASSKRVLRGLATPAYGEGLDIEMDGAQGALAV